MSRCDAVLWAACVLMGATLVEAQTDPGPRPGQPDAGRPLQGLTQQENATFQEGQRRFTRADSVSGTETGAPGSGLGPRFNLNSCVSCHGQPSPGGSSSSNHSPQNPRPNPQVAIATQFGAQNSVPSFIQADGPIRVARFVAHADGTPDGGVQSLFVITGRTDAGSCSIAQPDFAGALAQNNVIFRIPTPVFGAGLLEAIPDSAILANKAANADLKAALGISGHENRSANDGSITRFGWKAQTGTLELFAAEAYNVEIGVTNPLFRNERDQTPGCVLNQLPEDQTNFRSNSPVTAMSDVAAFAEFMRWLAPPAPQNVPGLNTQSVARGRQAFDSIGCGLCHTAAMTTGNTTSAALNAKPVPLFSDLLVHHMGAGLADGIQQGQAGPDEFRTAPLWGLGPRIYLLHDGRTTDLIEAIQQHGGEATATVGAFNSLPAGSMQDVLNFLRSL